MQLGAGYFSADVERVYGSSFYYDAEGKEVNVTTVFRSKEAATAYGWNQDQFVAYVVGYARTAKMSTLGDSDTNPTPDGIRLLTEMRRYYCRPLHEEPPFDLPIPVHSTNESS